MLIIFIAFYLLGTDILSYTKSLPRHLMVSEVHKMLSFDTACCLVKSSPYGWHVWNSGRVRGSAS
jgi:hypothetical protein